MCCVDDEKIRQLALMRIADVFNKELSNLALDAVFGVDLKASFVSYFKENEFGLLIDDVRDVADRSILKELDSEVLVIRTVGDYCEHMVRCYRTKPDEVARILNLDNKKAVSRNR